MHRRSFLQGAAGATLLMSTGPLSWFKRARAQTGGAPLYFLSFAAQGAWDMTSLGDPKGDYPHNRHYSPSDIQTVAGTSITYAPKETAGGLQTFDTGPDGDKQDFFQKFGNDLLVVRGVDTQTNSHDIGPRHMFSGNLRVGNPAHGALIAAIHEESVGQTLPMSFMSTGGFDNTQSLLPPSRVGNVAAFKDLARPYVTNPQGNNPERYFHSDIEALIKDRQQARAVRLQAAAHAPQIQSAMEALDRARSAESGFEPLYDVLKDLPELTGADASNALIPKAQIAIAAIASGQCVSANLHLGGFDTHQNHDTNHRTQLQLLLDAVDYTRRTMETMGLWDDTLLMMGSDFSRTTYNGAQGATGDGKDHWPITHALFMGTGVSGGRVVGQTDDGSNGDGTYAKGARAKKVKLQGGEVVVAADQNDPAAGFLTPADMMRALRVVYGVDGHPLSQKYGVGDTGFGVLPIFG